LARRESAIRSGTLIFSDDVFRKDKVKKDPEPHHSLKQKRPTPELARAVLIVTRRGNVSFISLSAKAWLQDAGLTPAGLLEALAASELDNPGKGFWFKTPTSRIRVRRVDANRKGTTCLVLEELRMPLRSLTHREAEVLYWLALSKTTADIATLMEIEVGTVRKHSIPLYKKILVENRTAAALFAYLFALAEGVPLTDENGAGNGKSCATFCDALAASNR
jgi:DNA-binding CsgD family transcriptional regulator